MSSSPIFFTTPNVGSELLGAADTSLTAPTTFATLVTGGVRGTKVEELVLEGVATTVAGVVNVFLHDGTTFHLIDQFLVSAVTSSATAVAFRRTKTYDNLLVPPTWTLRASQTVAGNASGLKLTAVGLDA